MARQHIIRRTFRDDDDIVDGGPASGILTFVSNIVYILITVLESLLLIRLLLSLGGANRTNQFADFIYNVTAPFVAPFRGLFNIDTTVGGNSRFEYEVLIAMVVYGLIAGAIIMLLRAMSRPSEEL